MSETDPKPFLSRWAKRKAGGQKEADKPEEVVKTEQAEVAGETDEEAALSDEELCAHYELPDPEKCTESEQLDGFFDAKVPDRLRQLAMRRLWRLNPLFRFADEMVEYGEDFTDAATVIPNMQTAYKVGKGYLDKLLAEQEQADAEAAFSIEQAAEQDELEGTANTDKSGPIEDDSEETAALPESGQQAESEQTEDPIENKENTKQTDAEVSPIQVDADTSEVDKKPSEPTIRPRRMVFTKSQA